NGTIHTLKDRFIDGMVNNGYERDFAERCFKQIQGFGEYGFPESHAASFALLVYASAWIKVHHPAAFAVGLLNSQPMGFYSPSTILSDAARHGVRVLPVSVTESDWDSTLTEDGALRVGLRVVRGLGGKRGGRIEAARGARAFDSVEDLADRAKLDKDEEELLAEAGALEGLVP